MADETAKLIEEFINKLNAFWKRESEECPHCGAHVEALEQVERSVTARPWMLSGAGERAVWK